MKRAELAAKATLAFAVAGGRTDLLRQRVAYPFHITRPFYLDAARPDLATLYLQSAAGGLYGGDRLELEIDSGAGSATCVTTQSATIVHDCQNTPARHATQLTLGAGALIFLAPDPLVLFPGAILESFTDITLGAGARALLQDGFACHDPAGANRHFASIRFETVVRDHEGRVLVADRGRLSGEAFGGQASPLGPWRACGTTFLLGLSCVDSEGLICALDALGCYAGAGALPNDAGHYVRLLAPDGGTLARGLLRVFAWGFELLAGHPPARRRK